MTISVAVGIVRYAALSINGAEDMGHVNAIVGERQKNTSKEGALTVL